MPPLIIPKRICLQANCPANATSQFFLKAPGTPTIVNGAPIESNTNDRHLVDFLIRTTGQIGDRVHFDVVDHDNALGLGVDFVVGKLHDEDLVQVVASGGASVSVHPGLFLETNQWMMFKPERVQRIPSGFWIRAMYVNTSALIAATLRLNIHWREPD